MDKPKKFSKLLILLGDYLGFSILCGFSCFLFFSWASKIVIYNFSSSDNQILSSQLQYWIHLLCIFAGIFITLFILILLIQKKFSYILKISSIVEEMEGGNLKLRIPLEGNDELTDLALNINHLSEAMSDNINQLELANTERFETIASLSHDLRTPLTAVMSYLQFIRDGQYKDEDQLRHYADRAFEKANRIKDLSDHLFYNCVTERDTEINLERVDGVHFLKTALAETESFLEESDFEVQIESLIDEYVFYLMIDQSKISRLFENLISNIQKYADSKYPVTFKLKLMSQYIILQQTNTVLMKQDKDIESHLLGLKGVKKTIEEMGGSLTVQEGNDIFTLEIQFPIC